MRRHDSDGKRVNLPLFFTALVALTTTVFLAGCGGSTTQTSSLPRQGGTTQVVALLSGTANSTTLSYFTLNIMGITLNSSQGKSFELYNNSNGVKVNFAPLNGKAEPLSFTNVPQGTYSSAEVSVGCEVGISTLGVNSSGGLDFGNYGARLCDQGPYSVKIKLASPITISGSAMALNFELQIPESYTITPVTFPSPSATATASPVFTLKPVTLAAQPTDQQNGLLTGMVGEITAAGSSGNRFTLQMLDGLTFGIETGTGTEYQGVSGFSSLAAGMVVDVNAAIQSNASLEATSVAADNTTAPYWTSGPTTSGSLQATNEVESYPESWLGFQEPDGPGYGFSSNSSTRFSIAGQPRNLASLPFTASFNAQNLFAGQNMALFFPTYSYSSAYPIAATVVLLPQTIDGAITKVSSSSGFSIFQVQLPAGNLFATLQKQTGSILRLTDPSEVYVYAGSGTQILASGAVGVGNNLRFRGLIFNDNGTLRMDCSKILNPAPAATSGSS